MNCYEVIKSYMRAWTLREITIVGLLLVVILALLLMSIRHHRLRKVQALTSFLLVLYLVMVFAATVFTRESGIRRYKLLPGWSWYAVFSEHNVTLLLQNILNGVLLIPVGWLLPFICNHKVVIRSALGLGILISLVIEICQLLFMCGLFEWDDMVHNGIGCMVGGFLGNLVWERISKRDIKLE